MNIKIIVIKIMIQKHPGNCQYGQLSESKINYKKKP